MSERVIFFTGIDGDTGDYLVPGMPLESFAARARQSPLKAPVGRGVKGGVVPQDLASAGWGIVFPPGVAPEVREALQPLVCHRREAAAAVERRRFQELYYRPRQGKRDFLAMNGAMPAGAVDPDRVPYYLLLVGDPREIPFSFQYDLGVQYAVGRLSFEAPEEYAHYARSVIEAESRGIRRDRRALLFAPQHPDDPCTVDTVEKLVRPLGERFADQGDWQVATTVGAEADKAALRRALGGDRGDQNPAILFTVSHGLGYWRPDHPLKGSHQGALVASDWPGPGSGPVSPDFCFAAQDLDDGADVGGMMSFHLACWSAGTPEHDYFLPEQKRIAEHDFIARLPQRLLAHPAGGALAVVGHVDRAWLHTFLWKELSQITLFESALADLMNSSPVGWAMRCFGEYYADLANDVLSAKSGELSDERYLEIWTSFKDAGGYVILGDPAARLTFSEETA